VPDDGVSLLRRGQDAVGCVDHHGEASKREVWERLVLCLWGRLVDASDCAIGVQRWGRRFELPGRWSVQAHEPWAGQGGREGSASLTM
jgi:hypothetical protein